MLELKNITKVYPAGGEHVQALKGISLRFRKSEFVSILGPSGCGKTTMLNIIGGLDQYTDGDLVIRGRSTRDFKDRDWDAYRNHSVGFVFQSYNLIPHQTVLQNVELALTLSGVGRKERRRRAKEALELVGLKDQMRKRPSEMSGGQMQRVAIARAIVNEPDIVLADEPTGALDTETGLQVMDILKKISADRLVIMVTHNPDLAERYSTRIVRMLDGRITADSAPFGEKEAAAELALNNAGKPGRRAKKPSMSIGTSFGLSLKNLFTKKGRTLLTAFAGSIGIIGIALIYAVSQGTTNYINAVQEDTLSSYPLTLEAEHVDIGTLIETFMGKAASAEKHENDAVYQKAMFYDLMNSVNSLEEQENDLASFKIWLEAERADPESTLGLHDAVSGVQYTYDIDLAVYTKNVDGNIIRSDSQALMSDLITEYMGMDMSAMLSARNQGMTSSAAAVMSSSSSMWQEMLCGDNGALVSPLLEKQYDLAYGRWPSALDEIVLVLDENNELDDLTLYALGLKSKESVDAVMRAAMDKATIEYVTESWSYEEICAGEYRVILNADSYRFDESTGTYTDLRSTDTGLQYLYDNAFSLKVVGIVRPSEDAVSSMLTGSIGYTHALTEYIIGRALESGAVKAQLDDPDTDILTGLPFAPDTGSLSEGEKADAFLSYLDALTVSNRADVYRRMMSIPDEALIAQAVDAQMSAMTRGQMEAAMLQAMAGQAGMDTEEISAYIAGMEDDEIASLFRRSMEDQFRSQYAAETEARLSAMTDEQLDAALQQATASADDAQLALWYDKVPDFSDSSYEDNLALLGRVDMGSPLAINLYASTFADKDAIEDAISAYNDSTDELHEIRYTDYVGLIMSSVTTIINAITYVLIAFVAVSLIVSSIMIGVITLISVQERTKEIGILRAIGASKKNVSSLFNAETVIIGLASGMIGVGITYLLCLPINAILHRLTGIATLSAVLPVPIAAVLVVISFCLTLFAGIIPSRSAAKKDPVVALRTE